MKSKFQISVDGPAGSGKSTVSKLIAQNHRFLYIDSGAMYRAVTLYLIKNKLLNKNENTLKHYIKKIKIKLVNKQNKQLIFLNNINVSKKIRALNISKEVSEVSSKKTVRESMVKQQRKLATNSPIIMDGRDIGSNVLKDANLKIYMTASALVRAKRRKKDFNQIKERVSIKDLLEQIQARDNYDSSRRLFPLCKPQDAVVIDSSNLTINEVLEQINIFTPLM